ncbi:hypothetical protein O181_040966 [Austropuccinia psidii MF-1]|uniref:Deacetylase sirtuin-type domain-containing protein n=1 Tax=Austropuccinia psidii MF-1 TaxID=1389203 RepID=A0A9Q3HDV5_9BASI|nr:hypothetical protein [Austropuccinia psidii MF-1]
MMSNNNNLNQTQLVVLPGTRKIGIGPLPSFVKASPADPQPELKRAIRAVLNAKKIAVVVGAGISTSANIPDFRSSNGLFASLKARFPNAKLTSGRDLFDVNAWKDPETLSLHLGMLAELHKMCGAAQPTAFHQFLKRLDDEGKLSRVYTQNIDGLEEKAGLSYGVPSHDEIQSSSSSSSSRQISHSQSNHRQKQNLKRKRGQEFPAQLPPTPRSTPPPSSSQPLPTLKDNNQLKPGPITRSNSQPILFPEELSDPGSSNSSSLSGIYSSQPPLSPSKTPRSKAKAKLEIASQTTGTSDETLARSRSSRPKPMDPFPRVIPLHGTLKNLSCLSCKHSVLMSDYIHSLAEGETVFCPQCQLFDDARALSGFRTRGVGLLKSGVVLYGEEHFAGDQVGAVTSRDLMRGRRPDLLIVAGTSLKVPGTKRLVKELSKVIKPPSKTSNDSEDGEEHKQRSAQSTRKKPPPIHTLFLNYDFPSPCGLWKDTFDIWVKGNVDQFIHMVDQEQKHQEELKLKRTQQKLERNKMNGEKPKAVSNPSQQSTLATHDTIPSKPTSRSIQSKSNKSIRLPVKKANSSSLKSKSTGSLQSKGSLTGFFKSGKVGTNSSQMNTKLSKTCKSITKPKKAVKLTKHSGNK